MEVGFDEIKGEMKALDQKAAGIDDRLKTQETKLTSIDTNFCINLQLN